MSNNILPHQEAHIVPTENLPDQPLVDSSNRRIKLIVVSTLLFIVVGSFIFPMWWFFFLFKGGFSTSSSWYGGISSICKMALIPLLVACTFLYVEPLILKRRLIGKSLSNFFDRFTIFVLEKDKFIVSFLVATLVASLLTLDNRSLQTRNEYDARILSQYDRTETIKTPLEQPSRFIFLATKVIDSLYKQREESLAIAKVTEEVQASKNIKGAVQFSEVFKTDAEKSEAQKRITEYQANKKAPEQQVKDLVGYLYKTGSMRSYMSTYTKLIPEQRFYVLEDGTRRVPEKSENEKINDSIQLLEKYGLDVDQEKLKKIRSRLMAREIQVIESDLRNIQGQILVIGDWSIQLKNDFYIFKRAFIDKVSDSPICEFKLAKSSITAESKSVIEDIVSSNKNAAAKLGVFGTVTSSVTGKSGKVNLDPIAVYLP
jgi:hypothetical protein